MKPETIRPVPTQDLASRQFRTHLADAVVMTHDGKILLQRRGPDCRSAPGALCLFGGHVEAGETPMEALVRELHEELGAIVEPADVTFLGAITEGQTSHLDVVHIHLWHDAHGTITGCYEFAAEAFDTPEQALADPGLMDYAAWALRRAVKAVSR